jgi:hypothetical protein
VRALLAAVVALTAAAPCAAIGEGDESDAVPGLQPASGLVLFYQSAAPMSFVAMTPKDVPENARKIREVRGVSCQQGLALPTALNFNATNVSAYLGDGSYGKAIAHIYDVRVDVEDFSILGFYSSLCTIVTARAFSLPGSPPAAEPVVPVTPKQ